MPAAALASLALWLGCSFASSVDDLSSGGGGGRAGSGPAAASAGAGPTSGTGGQAGAPGGQGAGGGAGGAPVTGNPPWWDGAWANRRPIAIDASGRELPAGLHVEVVFQREKVLGEGEGDSSLRVLRFSEASQTWGERPRVVESAPLGGTRLWFSLDPQDAPGGQSYWLYAGNAAAAEAPDDPATVFEFYESFNDGDLDPDRWSKLGDIELSGGLLGLRGGPEDASIASRQLFAVGRAFDAAARLTEIAESGQRFWLGFQREGDFENESPYTVWFSDNTFQAWPFTNVAAEAPEFEFSGDRYPIGNEMTFYTLERYDDHVMVSLDGAARTRWPLSADADQGPFDGPLALRFQLAFGPPSLLEFDFVRVRVAVDPPPSVALGEAEARP